MVDATKVTGKEANSTVKVFTSLARAMRNMVSGKMARESDGLAAKKALAVVLNEQKTFLGSKSVILY
jgi:hypothetical protein